jgi:hypothetical protein
MKAHTAKPSTQPLPTTYMNMSECHVACQLHLLTGQDGHACNVAQLLCLALLSQQQCSAATATGMCAAIETGLPLFATNEHIV